MKTLEERMDRLEKCFLTFTALITGEATKSWNAEELELMQTALGYQMTEMQQELK